MLIPATVQYEFDKFDLAAGIVQCSPSEASRGKILLVEDDASVRRYLEVTLQRARFDVIAVADGLAAMKQALSAAFDAVVTDAILPYVSGQEVCRFLRRQEEYTRIPLILLSGLQKPEHNQECQEADVFLVKPVRPEDLTECLERLMLARR